MIYNSKFRKIGCKGTTNFWNIQGFFAKSQIYLKFFHHFATVSL